MPFPAFLFLAALALSGCASKGPTLSGDFGTVPVPNANQVALLTLRSGEDFLARRLQEEEDTVFALRLDYSIRPVPLDSIAKIEIRSKTAGEEVDSHRPMTKQEKEALATTGVAAMAGLLIVVPILVLAFLAAKLSDDALD